ncbi:hypothetical protein KGF54_004985 [Candida jiufengensis]|uniref:uncharacterized protein n=1 Tax=Candida jiufengensis TaxID=497108 RepID=UPI0022255E8F|nr:uncharacterized protein KGF54_004985 [Candida jiufengensis]KAI5951910.1 hypothetical protein KGF54_004985 [Candida jiufengensis]
MNETNDISLRDSNERKIFKSLEKMEMVAKIRKDESEILPSYEEHEHTPPQVDQFLNAQQGQVNERPNILEDEHSHHSDNNTFETALSTFPGLKQQQSKKVLTSKAKSNQVNKKKLSQYFNCCPHTKTTLVFSIIAVLLFILGIFIAVLESNRNNE